MRVVVGIQGVYYVATGLWPLVSMSTFEAVTGPKTDDWLVHTVGVLAAAIGLTLLIGVRRDKVSAETATLSGASAVAFAGIDVFYALRGTIGPIYLADAVLQAVILAVLAAMWNRRTL